MILQKKYILLIIVGLIGCFMCACGKENEILNESMQTSSEEMTTFEETEVAREEITQQWKENYDFPVDNQEKEDTAEQWEKGYDLPVEEQEKEEAIRDCQKMFGLILDIYSCADKGNASNVILNNETIHKMQDRIKEKGYPVITMETYSNLENYEKVDNFLQECLKGKSGSVVVYELHSDGGIGRNKYIFDGKDMYLLGANAIWNMDNQPEMSYFSYTRIKEWKYRKKGWLCYELCVPEPPEVTEIVNGRRLLRIKPLTKEQQEMSEKCVQGIGYQGNNLLCSNWDTEHMEELDYNGVYEYLYAMKYQKALNSEDCLQGIPIEAFESLIMEYLPVTAEQIREYAVFDEESRTYEWEWAGCSLYAPNLLRTSLPVVTDIKENDNGTVTLTVDAVCDMVSYDDAVITHELTVRFADDGSFQYLGNKILNDGAEDFISDYQYRIHKE